MPTTHAYRQGGTREPLCPDSPTMTPDEIRDAIDAGRMGYDEDGQLTTRCQFCGNMSPDWDNYCRCW